MYVQYGFLYLILTRTKFTVYQIFRPTRPNFSYFFLAKNNFSRGFFSSSSFLPFVIFIAPPQSLYVTLCILYLWRPRLLAGILAIPLIWYKPSPGFYVRPENQFQRKVVGTSHPQPRQNRELQGRDEAYSSKQL
jgi:hypothetical protein